MLWEDIDWSPDDLQPEMRDIVESQAESDAPPIHALSVDGARALIDEQYGPPEDPTPVGSVRDAEIDGTTGRLQAADSIPIRIYTPGDEDEGEDGGEFPVLLWFHGGGFVLGGLEVADSVCRQFARNGCLVVSVGYRHAPENPFPAALKDCFAATEWAVEHADSLGGDLDRLGVAGGSAGGNLSAAVSLLARDLGAPDVDYQLVVYPMIDDDLDRESYRENPHGRADFHWYWEKYQRDPTDAANPYAFPLKANSFADLPPAEVVTVEFDILRDEGEEFAEELADAGVDVEHSHYEGAIHPFFNLDIPQADEAIAASARRFKDVTAD